MACYERPSMTANELFMSKDFKMIETALKRIDCNTLCLIHRDLAAYNLHSAFNYPERLVFMKDGKCQNIDFNALGISFSQLVHDSSIDGCIDPFDYPIIFNSLLAMNTWIGLASGKTLLRGDGNDIYQLEIEVNLCHEDYIEERHREL